jgi:drug/metabolite transporter (DMT)-like permease
VPLITALISYFLYQERLRSKQKLGLIVGFTGTITIILSPILYSQGITFGSLTGNLLVATAVVLFSFHTAFSKRMLKRFTPSTIIQSFIVTAILLITPLSLIETDFSLGWISDYNLFIFLAVAYNAVPGIWGLYYLFQKAIDIATPTIASLSMYLAPVFAVLLAIIILGERLTLTFVVGSILSMLGVYLVTFKAYNPNKSPKVV